VPFLDRRAARGERGRLFVWIGLAVIAYVLLLTYLGYTVSPTR
jgi:type VI protein secretion system component VasF